MNRPVWCARFLLVVTLGAAAAVHAEPIHTIGFSYGGAYLARQDLVFSPMAHRSFSPIAAQLSYERAGRMHHAASISFSTHSPILVPSYEFTDDSTGDPRYTLPHSFNFLALEYALGVPLLEDHSGRIVVGGSLPQEIDITSYTYSVSGVFGYSATFSLAAWMQGSLALGERVELTGTLRIPVVGWLARSPYLVNDDEYIENISSNRTLPTFAAFIADGSLASFGRVQRADLSLLARYSLRDRWTATAELRYGFARVAVPLQLLSYKAQLLAGMEVRL